MRKSLGQTQVPLSVFPLQEPRSNPEEVLRSKSYVRLVRWKWSLGHKQSSSAIVYPNCPKKKPLGMYIVCRLKRNGSMHSVLGQRIRFIFQRMKKNLTKSLGGLVMRIFGRNRWARNPRMHGGSTTWLEMWRNTVLIGMRTIIPLRASQIPEAPPKTKGPCVFYAEVVMKLCSNGCVRVYDPQK